MCIKWLACVECYKIWFRKGGQQVGSLRMATLSKKFGQFRQWTGEKLGTKERTQASEEFRRLQMETECRKNGIDRCTVALTDYAKTLDKRSSQDKSYSALYVLAKSLIQQGQMHGSQTPYGMALQSIGEIEERLEESQATMVLIKIKASILIQATTVRQGVLFQMMGLQTAMKDFSHLKKKLENRRLDYDAKMSKLSKSKKEKPGLEEEMKTAQNKYYETLGDMENLMTSLSQREEQLLESFVLFADCQYEYFRKGLELMEELRSALRREHLEDSSRRYSESKANLSVGKTATRPATILPQITPAPTNSEPITRDSDHKLNAVHQSDTSSARSRLTSSPQTRSSSILNQGTAPTEHIEEYVEALYSFEAENEGEISLCKGDCILVVKKIDEGWWVGRCNGLTGMFPSNYVRPWEQKASSLKPNGANISRRPSAKEFHPPSIAPSEPGSCNECGCSEFISSAFKPGRCNNCFHQH